jgi:hypothetical protein
MEANVSGATLSYQQMWERYDRVRVIKNFFFNISQLYNTVRPKNV